MMPYFVNGMTYEGTLVEDTLRRVTSVNDVEFVPFLKSGENSVDGEEMVRRARNLGADYGQGDAEWFLEHQDQLLPEFRDLYLVFPGTVRKSSKDGDGKEYRYVPYLYWFGESWYLKFYWLGNAWLSQSGRFLRPRK